MHDSEWKQFLFAALALVGGIGFFVLHFLEYREAGTFSLIMAMLSGIRWVDGPGATLI